MNLRPNVAIVARPANPADEGAVRSESATEPDVAVLLTPSPPEVVIETATPADTPA